MNLKRKSLIHHDKSTSMMKNDLGGIIMLRLAKIFLLIGILSLLLAACGTSSGSENGNESANSSEQTDKQTEQKEQEEQNEDVDIDIKDESSVEQTVQEENNENNNATEPQEQTDTQTQEEVESPASEQTISYSFNGESKEEQAFLQKSDNQGFSLYVLPDYELTAEEPYNDSLFLKENDAIFMRISVLPADSDIDSLKENATAQLQVVNENVQTLTPPDDEFLQNATIMEASNNGEVVTSYLIEKQESIIKLTLFTTEQTDYRDAFIQMAKTIKVEN